MSRMSFLRQLLGVRSLQLQQPRDITRIPLEVWTFADLWNSWVPRFRDRIHGMIDARALREWREVRDAWTKARRVIDNEY